MGFAWETKNLPRKVLLSVGLKDRTVSISSYCASVTFDLRRYRNMVFTYMGHQYADRCYFFGETTKQRIRGVHVSGEMVVAVEMCCRKIAVRRSVRPWLPIRFVAVPASAVEKWNTDFSQSSY